MLSRRSFLGGALAVTTVAAAGLPALASLPVIRGDGIHDDTDGLQALFDGKPFVCEGEACVAVAGTLYGGKFRLTRTLHYGRTDAQVTLGNVCFSPDPHNFSGDYTLRIHSFTPPTDFNIRS